MKKKVCIIVTTPMTAKVFLKDQIRALSEYFDITLVANFYENPKFKVNWDNVTLMDIPLSRSVKPFKDIKALHRLYHFIRDNQFDLVHTVTPKAGLIGMMAAFLSKVDIRIHFFTGQVWVTRRGFAYHILKLIDRILALLTTHTYADSPSQRDFLINMKIVPSRKIKTLASGSISGVDTLRFKPDNKARQGIIEQYALSTDAIIILFLGRISKDKGVHDLINAFGKMNEPKAHLFLVGPDECGIKKKLTHETGGDAKRVHLVGFTSEPEKYMSAADIFCMPSLREGFGSVIIEAAACGVPSIASRIYGITDAVIHGVTGFLIAPSNQSELITRLVQLSADSGLRKQMGAAARNRAVDLFRKERVTKVLVGEYRRLIG